MAEKAISFEADFKNETDKPSIRKVPLKSGKSLVGALRAKYCMEDDSEAYGHILVFKGRQRKKSNSEDAAELEYLTNVCLSNSNIRRSGLEKQSITSLCPNVIDLDISGNRIESWNEILPVIQQLKSLKFLNVARNMIDKDKQTCYNKTVGGIVINPSIMTKCIDWKYSVQEQCIVFHNACPQRQDVLHDWTRTLPGLENLVLNGTGANWQEILHLATLLPHLKELHICGNNFTEIPAGRHRGLDSVECLRMNNNNIVNWNQVWKLRYLPNLKFLVLSGNPLMDIFYNGDEPECTCTCHIDSNFEGNSISSFHGNSISNSNTADETFQVEIRQYCENILNAVIDDVIRSDVVNDGNNFEIENFEKDQNELFEEAGSRSELNGNKIETFETKADSISVKCDNLEQKDVEQISREIVDTVLQRAIAFVECTNNMEADADKPRAVLKDDRQVDFGRYSENQKEENQNTNTRNDGNDTPVQADSAEVSCKGQHSCCPCEEIPDCDTPFNSLETLCVSETHIGKWKHLSALRGFPALRSVRIKNVKLGATLNDEDRRKLFMASLPNIKLLNGSEVTPAEREKSERHLLRHFCEKKQKPDIYHVLESKHGKLTPLVDIDLSKGYTDFATLSFVYQGKEVFSETVCVREPVGSLRKLICIKLNRQVGLYDCLYHKHCNSLHDNTVGELEEIRCDSLPMSRIDILDGDEIHIDDTRQQPSGAKQFNPNYTVSNR